MMSYWAEFAYSGSPGKGRDGKLPRWLAWSNAAQESKFMRLDTPDDGGLQLQRDAISTQAIKHRLRTDSRITSSRKRCKLYVEMYLDSPFWNDAEYQTLADNGCRDPLR
jgi:para-nitrobenzyl esterase